MKAREKLWRQNCRSSSSTWGKIGVGALRQLKILTIRHYLSVGSGEPQLLNGHWYVTHTGLLGIAQRKRCSAITTTIVERLSDPSSQRWVCRAIVYKAAKSRGFAGYGDANPSNVSPVVRGAEMRVAETRAVNRALRKAYGIGLCSVDELGWSPRPSENNPTAPVKSFNVGSNGYHRNEPRLRDQLCLLIRQHNLNPGLVKAYAAHFCGTETLKDASRDLVESFISHLSSSAKEDLDGLICKLNSCAPVEVKQ